MPDICDSGEGEQPFHLLSSALEMDFSVRKERSPFFPGLEADGVTSSLTARAAHAGGNSEELMLSAHLGFVSEEEH